jgi:hypothetical protein
LVQKRRRERGTRSSRGKCRPEHAMDMCNYSHALKP